MITSVTKSRLMRASGVAAVLALVIAGRTMACSCVSAEMILRQPGPHTAVFTGITGDLRDGTYPLTVTDWLYGVNVSQELRIDDDFGPNSAACQLAEPPAAGVEYIFVLQVPDPDSTVQLILCSPHAPVDSDEGRQLLALADELIGLPDTSTAPIGGAVEGTSAVGPAVIALSLTAVLGVLASVASVLRLFRS